MNHLLLNQIRHTRDHLNLILGAVDRLESINLQPTREALDQLTPMIGRPSAAFASLYNEAVSRGLTAEDLRAWLDGLETTS